MSEFQVELADSEEGEVIAIDGENATIKIVSAAVCSSCALKGNCATKGKDITIIVERQEGIKIGDRVVIRKSSGGILWGALILFGGPVVMLIVVYMLAVALGAGSLISALLAIASLFAFYFIVKLAGITNWLTRKYSYHIERTLAKEGDAG